MEPPKPNPTTTAEVIEQVKQGVVVLSGALGKASKASKPEDRLPFEREFQIQRFLEYTGTYAQDLGNWHKQGRMDWLAQTLRCLMELSVWIDFCNVSEKNWRQFVDDSARDMREMAEVTLKMYAGKNQELYEKLSQGFAGMHRELAKRGVRDIDRKYLSVRDAATQLGRIEVHSMMYKVASKQAHPTALFFTLFEENPEIKNAIYAEGSRVAGECLNECQKSVAAKYPELFIAGSTSPPQNPSA